MARMITATNASAKSGLLIGNQYAKFRVLKVGRFSARCVAGFQFLISIVQIATVLADDEPPWRHPGSAHRKGDIYASSRPHLFLSRRDATT